MHAFPFRDRNARALLHGASAVLAVAIAAPAIGETVRRARGEGPACPFPTLPPIEAAARALEGRLVFVDVREPAEVAEFRVPGAIPIPLRDLDAADLAPLRGAEVVVPYCLKDFRGFEGARALARRGVPGIALLQGFGLSSWKGAGLPLAGESVGRSDRDATEAMRERLRAKRP